MVNMRIGLEVRKWRRHVTPHSEKTTMEDTTETVRVQLIHSARRSICQWNAKMAIHVTTGYVWKKKNERKVQDDIEFAFVFVSLSYLFIYRSYLFVRIFWTRSRTRKTELLAKHGECPHHTSILRAVSCVAIVVRLTLTLFELWLYLVARVHDTEERIQGRTMKRIDPCSEPTLFVWSGLWRGFTLILTFQ